MKVILTLALVLWASVATAQDFKPYLESQWTANNASWKNNADAGSAVTNSSLRFAMVGINAAYKAFDDTTYLSRNLDLSERMVIAADNVDGCGYFNWYENVNTPVPPGNCSITNGGSLLFEAAGAMEMAQVSSLIKANAAFAAQTEGGFSDTNGERADAILAWLHTNIVQKWLVSRGQESWLLNNNAKSDKHPTWVAFLVAMDSAGYNNTAIRTGLTYRQFIIALLNDYMAQVSAPATNTPGTSLNIAGAGAEIWYYQAYTGTEFCGTSPNTMSPCSEDVSHGNIRLLALQRAADAGFSSLVNSAPTGSTLAQHVVKLERLVSQIVWNGSTSQPQFRNYMDGENHFYRHYDAWVNGTVSWGVAMVAHHHQNSVDAMVALTSCVIDNNSCNTASWKGNGDSTWVRTGLAGTTALAQARIGGGGEPPADPASNGMIVEYFFDEAASGGAPSTVEDTAAGTAVDLTLTYGATQPVYVELATGRGLRWDTQAATGKAEAAIDGTKFKTQMHNRTKWSVEIVSDVTTGSIGSSRILQVGVGTAVRLIVAVSATEIRFGSDMGWNLTYPLTSGRHTHTMVYDSRQAAAADRIKYYRDGNLVAPSTGSAPELYTLFDLLTGQSLTIGNGGAAGAASPVAAIYYVAFHDEALSSGTVGTKATALAALDDETEPDPAPSPSPTGRPAAYNRRPMVTTGGQ